MKRRHHAAAMATLVVAAIGDEPSRGARKLRAAQLRWAAERTDEQLACELGVLALVEAARDAHLARLEPDDGLATLCVPWEEIAAEAVTLLDRPRPRECPRCGARLSRSRPVCGRCRSPTPGHA